MKCRSKRIKLLLHLRREVNRKIVEIRMLRKTHLQDDSDELIGGFRRSNWVLKHRKLLWLLVIAQPLKAFERAQGCRRMRRWPNLKIHYLLQLKGWIKQFWWSFVYLCPKWPNPYTLIEKRADKISKRGCSVYAPDNILWRIAIESRRFRSAFISVNHDGLQRQRFFST